MSAAARALGQTFRWSTVLEPLAEFCAAPRRSPDLLDPVTAKAIARGRQPHAPRAGRGRRSAPSTSPGRGEWQALGTKAVGKVRRQH